LEPVPATQEVNPTRAFAVFLVDLASLFERLPNRSSPFKAQQAKFVIAKWHPQVFMYLPQDILNSDTNTRVTESFDVDNLWTPSEVLQF
jgi:hypothetical protein